MRARVTVGLPGAIVAAAVALVVSRVPVAAQGTAVAKSTAAVKELTGLMAAKKLEAFATHDGDSYKFVAVLLTPGVELLAVAATYDRPGDLDYQIDHNDYASTYADLHSGIAAKDKFLVEDVGVNGLVAQPKKGDPPDVATVGTERHTFDGVFNNPGKTDPKKPLYDAYWKAFNDADERYARLLGVLIEALKK